MFNTLGNLAADPAAAYPLNPPLTGGTGLGISAFHRQDRTLSTLLELGDGDSVEDLLARSRRG